MHVFINLLILIYTSLSFASINYSGRIIDQSTSNPLSSADARIQMSLQVGACTIYQENHDAIDFSLTNGYFSQNLGEGSATHGVFADAIRNSGSVSCLEGGSVSLSEASSRVLNISFYDGSGYSNLVASVPNLALKKSSDSYNSRLLNGKSSSSFIEQVGSVSQSVLESLASGASSLYASASSLSSSFYNKTESDAKFLDKTDPAQARLDIGLGSLATKSSVEDADISALSFSKLTGIPSFASSTHSHAISDVTNLQTSLDEKLAKASFPSCSASQVPTYISVSDTFSCSNISIASTQVSGLGPLATANQIGDSAITDLAGSKLTGPLQVGTVAGSTCSTIGLIRYESGNIQLCDGAIWNIVANNSILNAPNVSASYWVSTTFTASPTVPINFNSKEFDTHNAVTVSPTAWRFTAPVSGLYAVDALFIFSAPGSGYIKIRKNGATYKNFAFASNSGSSGSGSVKIELAANDYIDLVPDTSLQFNGGTLNGSSGNINITRIKSEPNAKIVFSGYVSSNQALTANVTNLPFTTIKDTHGSWNGSAFTCPVDGDYQLNFIGFASSGAASMKVYKNGSLFSVLNGISNTQGWEGGAVLVENCLVGQTISIRSDSPVTVAGGTPSTGSRVSIIKAP